MELNPTPGGTHPLEAKGQLELLPELRRNYCNSELSATFAITLKRINHLFLKPTFVETGTSAKCCNTGDTKNSRYKLRTAELSFFKQIWCRR
jgi:hypothetical protein